GWDRAEVTFSLRPPVSLLTAAALALGQLSPLVASAEPISRADYDACQAKDDNALRAAVVRIATDAITNGTKSIDYNALVADQWRLRNLDQIIDSGVDIAVNEVANETSWSDRLQSLAYAEKSQELATMVTERVYRSDAVKAAIADLAGG